MGTTLTVAVASLVGPIVGAVILLGTDLPVLLAKLTLLFLDIRARETGEARDIVAAPAPTG